MGGASGQAAATADTATEINTVIAPNNLMLLLATSN